MRPLWVAIDSTNVETRILATAGPKETVLKARLCSAVQHPRAVPALLEALAMWQGTAVHAAVVVDGKDNSSATRLKLGWLSDFVGEPLYKLTFVDRRKRYHHDPIEGLGLFHDLRQLVMFEVAR